MGRLLKSVLFVNAEDMQIREVVRHDIGPKIRYFEAILKSHFEVAWCDRVCQLQLRHRNACSTGFNRKSCRKERNLGGEVSVSSVWLELTQTGMRRR